MSRIQESLFSVDELLQLANRVNKDEFIDLIKQKNLHVLKINDAGQTLLHIAAKRNDIKLTQLLIEAGSDVNTQDILGKAPIVLAIENKTYKLAEIIKIFCQANANIYITDRYGKSAVQRFLDWERSLYDRDNDDLDWNGSIYVRDNDEEHELFLNTIHNECMNNSQMTAEKLMSLNYPIWHAVLLRNAEVIEQMIKRGCIVNHPNKKYTALGRAVALMDLEMVKLLIKYGADVDLTDNIGNSPIGYYGFERPGRFEQPEIIKILLNRTFLLKELGKEYQIVQFRRAFQFGCKEVIQMLLEYRNDILHLKDSQNQTPLHYLSGNYHSDVTDLLQNQEIDANIKDISNVNPLFTAMLQLHPQINTLKFLLVNGADVNAKSNFGSVPLIFLCRNDIMPKETYLKIVEMFLEYGLNIQFVGTDNDTVFDYISRHKVYFKAEPLIAHLVIEEEQNNSISECIRDKINAHKVFKKCLNDCKAELVEMKNITITKNLTLYTILINKISDERIMNMCRLSSNALFNLEALKNKFQPNNHYYTLVQKRISSIISKIELLHKATPTLCKILNLGNDHIVISKIIDYLDIPDLQNLLKVGTME